MTHVSNFYRYSMFCVTENKNVLTILESTGTPTTPSVCPNDVIHTIASDSVKLIEITYKDRINISESERKDVETSGSYYAETIRVDILKSDSIKTKTIYFPINMTLFSILFSTHQEHNMDSMVVYAAKDVLIGVTLNTISESATVIDVLVQTLQNVSIGYYITLKEGDTTNNLGRILNIDWVNNQITVEHATTNSFSISSSILLSVKFADMTFGAGHHQYALGINNIGGNFIKKNTSLFIEYSNNSNIKKSITFLAEFTY